MEQSQFDASIRVNYSGGADPSGLRSGEEEVSIAVVMEEANDEH